MTPELDYALPPEVQRFIAKFKEGKKRRRMTAAEQAQLLALINRYADGRYQGQKANCPQIEREQAASFLPPRS